MAKNKILIIEDSPDVLDMYNVKFSSENYNVITAKDGEEGMKKILEEKPDIILLDIIMPNMNGLEMLKKIKDEGIKANIIVLSNLGQEGQKKTALELGASHYLVKANYTPAEVVDKVKELIK